MVGCYNKICSHPFWRKSGNKLENCYTDKNEYILLVCVFQLAVGNYRIILEFYQYKFMLYKINTHRYHSDFFE